LKRLVLKGKYSCWALATLLFFTSDEIAVLLEDSSNSDSVESGSASAESEIDYAQDKFELAEVEAKEDNTEAVTVRAVSSDTQWVWCDRNA
jgi:hypothetical protein